VAVSFSNSKCAEKTLSISRTKFVTGMKPELLIDERNKIEKNVMKSLIH
jgi:hypothetical protein